MPDPQQQIGAVLGRIPSGIFILSARNERGDETGMLASWVQQAGFDPPSVTLAVNKQRYLHDWLVPGAMLGLSVVGETQKQFLGHFGKGFEPGAPAFQGLAVERTPADLPVLADALGWLEGSVHAAVDAGDHTVVVVRLTAAGAGDELATQKPYVHIRKSGLGY